MAFHDYPSHVFAMTNIGNVHLKMGNYYKAGFWYRRALKIEPSDLFALANLAEVYLARDKIPQNIYERL